MDWHRQLGLRASRLPLLQLKLDVVPRTAALVRHYDARAPAEPFRLATVALYHHHLVAVP